MTHKSKFLKFSLITSFFLPSCAYSQNGKIIFNLEGGSFLDESFSTKSLTGQAGTPVKIDIPNPYKEGYFFVGWREKDKNGSYRTINKILSDDGKSYYYYPYGSDTFYAYFEPLVTITFDLTEGKESGKLVSPKYESENFNGTTLNGYSSKVIYSNDYLPSADASEMHLNFSYWYSIYPLKKETDSNNVDHYLLDTSKELGEYKFTEQFLEDRMQFLLDSSLTLYAKWDSDPTITIHFNIDGMDDYSFQEKNNISTSLTSIMKEKFGFDYSIESSEYIYIDENKRKRFDGFYQDAKLTQPFFIDSSIYTKDIDIYLAWSNAITITLDYNGGNLDNESSHIIEGYYEHDVLPSSILKDHIPNKINSTFKEYTFNNESFVFEKTKLIGNDMVLYAQYSDYPKLTLSYDYPISYSKEKQSNVIYYIKENEDISTYLSAFKDAMLDDSLVTDSFYKLDSNSKKINLTSTTIPDKDVTIYLSLDYKAKVNILTYTNETGIYKLNENIDTLSSLTTNGKIDLNNYKNIQDDVLIDSDIYIFDGIYTSSSFNEEVQFPYHLESSHIMQNEISFIRKMTKAIILTFVDENQNYLGSLNVIPSSHLSDYQAKIQTLIGNSYKSLKIGDEILSDILPSSDETVTVVF